MGDQHGRTAEMAIAFDAIMVLSPKEFEQFCALLLHNLGFRVALTNTSGDGGVDIIAENPNPIFAGTYVVQCKRYSGAVGEPAVRDLYGVVTAQRANKGILITTGSFTRQAYDFARDKNLELVAADELSQLLRKANLLEADVDADDALSPSSTHVGSADVDALLGDWLSTQCPEALEAMQLLEFEERPEYIKAAYGALFNVVIYLQPAELGELGLGTIERRAIERCLSLSQRLDTIISLAVTERNAGIAIESRLSQGTRAAALHVELGEFFDAARQLAEARDLLQKSQDVLQAWVEWARRKHWNTDPAPYESELNFRHRLRQLALVIDSGLYVLQPLSRVEAPAGREAYLECCKLVERQRRNEAAARESRTEKLRWLQLAEAAQCATAEDTAFFFELPAITLLEHFGEADARYHFGEGHRDGWEFLDWTEVERVVQLWELPACPVRA